MNSESYISVKLGLPRTIQKGGGSFSPCRTSMEGRGSRREGGQVNSVLLFFYNSRNLWECFRQDGIVESRMFWR